VDQNRSTLLSQQLGSHSAQRGGDNVHSAIGSIAAHILTYIVYIFARTGNTGPTTACYRATVSSYLHRQCLPAAWPVQHHRRRM